ncbi:MAG TPA: glycoside hydrolase family 99-like domain-containing protein [Mycobacteriales bacterium]|nr:glycoside hydrolase family 99-like domain-containing protein [Mycobacteriales bacterium]
MDALRCLAFYLPQFHPVAENDEWWGEGFTEWTNVRKARPLFPGHVAPRVPGELGYYDLRDPVVRAAQAALAHAHGIDGFVYYHYWFNGRRLLERPFTEVLSSGAPDRPFALCWANENWTRVWDGGSRDVLMQQRYDAADDIAHIRSLLPAFADPRYVRVDGKPLFLVYRLGELPEPARTAERWRAEVQKAGLGDLFLVRVESQPGETGDPVPLGFDAACGFSPRMDLLPPPAIPFRLARKALRSRGVFGQRVVEYDEIVEQGIALQEDADYLRFPCVMPRFDNSARRSKNALIVRHSTPDAYGAWVRRAIAQAPRTAGGERLLFVNAWNEWAEGNHLEPEQVWGRAYLEAHRDALR